MKAVNATLQKPGQMALFDESIANSTSHYPYPVRGNSDPTPVSKQWKQQSLRSISTAPRNARVQIDQDQSVIAQVAAQISAGLLRWNSSAKSWMQFDGRVWTRNDQAGKAVLQTLLAPTVMRDARATLPPFIQVVSPISDKKRAARSKEAIAAGLAVEIDGELYDATSVTAGMRKKFELLTEVTSSDSHSIQAVETLLKAQPVLSTVGEDYDSDRDGLNTRSGWLDLRTGEIDQWPADKLATKITRADFTECDPEVSAWEQTLAEYLPDEDIRKFFQRAVGMSLSGRITERAFFQLTGPKSCGKSSVLELIRYALGDYAAAVPKNIIQSRWGEASPFDLIVLKGLRMAIIPEPKSNRAWNVDALKMLASVDVFSARNPHEANQEVEPSHTLFIASNYRPTIPGADSAFWDRYYEIPFHVQFVPENEVKKPHQRPRKQGIMEELKQRPEEILAWAVRGYKDYIAQGLNPPTAVLEARRDASVSGSLLDSFVAECFELDELGPGIPAALAYDMWTTRKAVENAKGDAPNRSNRVSMIADAIDGAEYVPSSTSQKSAWFRNVALSGKGIDFLCEVYTAHESVMGKAGLEFGVNRVTGQSLPKIARSFLNEHYTQPLLRMCRNIDD